MTCSNHCLPVQFAEARYWDQRYTQEERTFEWYRDYSSLEPLLKATFPLDAKLLQVGALPPSMPPCRAMHCMRPHAPTVEGS